MGKNNDVIKAVIKEYAALPYIWEQLSNIPKCDIQFAILDQLFLDVLLMKIRSKTIYYATIKKQQITLHILDVCKLSKATYVKQKQQWRVKIQQI